MDQNISFPKKNWNPFVSSVSPAIIQERIGKLDCKSTLYAEFLRSVVEEVCRNKNAVLVLNLFHFIELKGTKCPIQKNTNRNSEECKWIKNQPPKICLLYTSPSPRDRQKSRMPSSA